MVLKFYVNVNDNNLGVKKKIWQKPGIKKILMLGVSYSRTEYHKKIFRIDCILPSDPTRRIIQDFISLFYLTFFWLLV